MSSTEGAWVEQTSDDSLAISVSLGIYPLETLFRVCYLFTDRCFLFLSPNEDRSAVKVQFAKRIPDCGLRAVVGEFGNELVNQRVRMDIANETRSIRELIVAQAFAEADLLDRSIPNSDYHSDPKGIAK